MKLNHTTLKNLIKEILTESDVRYLTEQHGFDNAAFKKAVMASKPGDKFTIFLLRDVRKPVLGLPGPIVFKKGKTYRGTVIEKGFPEKIEWVEIEHEEIIGIDKQAMRREEFVEEINKQGAPCEIIDCDKSKVTRERFESKTFNEFLKNPTFEKAETEEEAEEEPQSITIIDDMVNYHGAPLSEVLEHSTFDELDIKTLDDVSDVMVTATVENMTANRALIFILKPLADEGAIAFNWGEDGKFTIWKPEAEEEAEEEATLPPTRTPKQRKTTRTPTRRHSTRRAKTPSSPIGPPSGTGTLMHKHKGGQKLMQTPEEVELCMKYPDHYVACFQSLVDQGYGPAIKMQKQGKSSAPKGAQTPGVQQSHKGEELSRLGTAGYPYHGCGSSGDTPWGRSGYPPGVSQFGGKSGTISWWQCVQAVGKRPKSSLRESTNEKTFSSFPEHQKLFESWNKYLNRE